MWFANRVKFRQGFLSFLFVIALALILFGLGGIGKVYLVDKNRNEALEVGLTKEKLNYQMLAEVNRPTALQIRDSFVVKSSAGKYDFAAEVVNVNQKWHAQSFDYYFVFGEEKTAVKKGYILPGETAYLVNLGVESESLVSESNLIVENINWQKVPEGFVEMKQKMLKLEVKNINLISSQSGQLSDKSDVANISFEVVNMSNYNYWQPHFTVLVFRRGELVAVSDLIMDSLDTGERKVESLNIFQYIPRDVEIKIVPDINILDQRVFKSFDLQQKIY